MTMRTLLIASGIAASCWLASAAHAQTPTAGPSATPDAARLLASGCASCHGTGGRAEAGAMMLAGLDRTYFTQQMQAFRSGARPATVMHQIAKGYTDADIELLAGYFAAQRR